MRNVENGTSRRALLRGLGVTMTLPWLESIPVWGATSAAPPKRFAVLFMGNGVNGNHWWAKGQGAEMQLSRSLAPLEPVKQKINVINGLFNKPAVGVGIHPGQTGNLLNGMPLEKGATPRAGVTVDQVLANHVGQDTAQRSMVLACERPVTGCHETNFSMAYSSHLSWYSAGSPAPNQIDPSLAFDALFENRGSHRNRSVLDRVKDGADGLSKKVSSTDKAKLDEYLTSVREMERRIDGMRNGLPEDVREHAPLMTDLIATAFQTDRTRIATLLLCRDLSGMRYPFLNVTDDHHAASHDDLSDAYERITRFHVSQFARLAARLDAMKEGEGTVLDNSCLLFLSNMWSGWKHDNMKLPVVMAGGLGGTLNTGRSLEYLYAGDDNRKLCSLYLSIMDRMGVKLKKFGDAETRLQSL